jgi:uncharacterized protein DUF4440
MFEAGQDAEIAESERAWMDAWLRRDRATCDRLLAPDFLLTSARGVLIPMVRGRCPRHDCRATAAA